MAAERRVVMGRASIFLVSLVCGVRKVSVWGAGGAGDENFIENGRVYSSLLTYYSRGV
jgi:hypothetical protein